MWGRLRGGAATPALVYYSGINWTAIAAIATLWEVYYQVAKLICARSRWPKVRELGASYVVAFTNACVCTVLGAYYAWELFHASAEHRAYLDERDMAQELGQGVKLAAYPFVAWVCYDIVHIILNYPRLGGVDQLLHHSGFLILTAIAMSWGLFPFTAAWLLLGELSSLPLNIRWALINTGQGESKALHVTNLVFAALFFVVRVIIYWGGLYEMVANTRPLLLSPRFGAPSWLLNMVCGFVTGGAILNAYWFVKIVKMASRKPGRNKKQ